MPPVRLILLCALALSRFATAQDDLHALIQRGHSDIIVATDISDDGRFLVTGSADHTVKLWDLSTGREIRTFTGHQGGIKEVRLDEEHDLLVSAAETTGGAELRTWSISSGSGGRTVKAGKDLTMLGVLLGDTEIQWAFEVRSFDVHPNGTLVWGEDNLGVKIGKISRAAYDRILDTPWQPTIVRYDPAYKTLVSGGRSFGRKVGTRSNEIARWNANDFSPLPSLTTRYDNIRTLCFDRSGERLAVLSFHEDSTQQIGTISHNEQQALELFSMTSGTRLFSFPWSAGESYAMALSPDGQILAYAEQRTEGNALLVIIDAVKGAIVGRVDSGEKALYSMAFSPDGRVLIANGRGVNFWRVGSWHQFRQILNLDRIEEFRVEGRKLITSIPRSDRVLVSSLDMETGRYEGWMSMASNASVLTRHGRLVCRKNQVLRVDLAGQPAEVLVDGVEGWDAVTQVKLTADEAFAVCLNENSPKVYVKPLTATGKGTFLEGHRRAVVSVASFENLLATGGRDNRILIWDIITGKKLGELAGHNTPVLALEFNPDGSLLASGSSDGYVKLWDVKKLTFIETLRGHSSDVLSLDFDASGSTLISASGEPGSYGASEIIAWNVQRRKLTWRQNGNAGYTRQVQVLGSFVYSIGNDPSVRIYDLDKGSLHFQYVPVSPADFVLSTSGNYYMGTKESMRYVHFVKGVQVYSFDNFDLKYNRPDVVLKELGSSNANLMDAHRKIYLRRLRNQGFTEAAIKTEFQLPATRILNLDSLGYLAEQNTVSLSLSFDAFRSKLHTINVWVNGVPLYGTKGLRTPDRGRYDLRVSVPLIEGLNKIEAGCTTREGVESLREQAEVIWSGKEPQDLYVVTVCTSRYRDPSMNLTYSTKDGRDLVDLFQAGKQFDHVFPVTLSDEQVTRENFLQVRKKLEQAKPNDKVVLFMAGHGILDPNLEFHFVTYDMNLAEPGANGISFEDIEHLIDSLPARHKVVLIDACHSGGIDKQEIEEKAEELARGLDKHAKVQRMDALRRNAFRLYYGVDNTFVELMETMYSGLGDGTGAYVISAAAGNGYAFESEKWNNGVFTYSLINGLRNALADADTNGQITVRELKEYLITNVVRLTDNQQRPTCRKENPDLDFIVWNTTRPR